MYLPQFNTFGLPEIFTILAGVGFILVTIYYCNLFLPLHKLKENHLVKSSDLPTISVIICAKNEDDNLTEFLPKVLSQNYPNFEVIVVNDCSYDNTENVIDEFAKIFPNLRKANIKEDDYYKHGKKFAMLVGIKAAKHNNLIFTDADCFPNSENWLTEMASGFTNEKEIVLGYGAYERKNTFLNKLIRYDTFTIAVNYLSMAIKGNPYMGVGRNLAYTSKLFYAVKGFSNHYHIQSGDDDLFVNTASNEKNTNICISKDAITYSKPKTTLRNWRLQKARHLTTAPLYNSKTKAKLLFNYFCIYFFYLSLIPLSFSLNTILLLPSILLLKMIVQWALTNRVAKRLNENDLVAGSVLYELFLLFLYPIFQLTKIFYKPKKWTT